MVCILVLFDLTIYATVHHIELNATIDAYSGTLDGIEAEQRRITEMKSRMLQIKDLLKLKRADLLQMFIRKRQYQEMLRMIGEMYYLIHPRQITMRESVVMRCVKCQIKWKSSKSRRNTPK